MAYKKRVEEEPSMEGFQIDDSIQDIPMQPIQKHVDEDIQEEAPRRDTPATKGSTGTVNCLRNERIIARYIMRPTSMVQNPQHILYGGMAETAVRGFVVPRLSSSGLFKNVLTNAEKDCLEEIMGLEHNALSVHKRDNNFWDDSNPQGIGRVLLHKQDNYFDMSIPTDYIKVKILMANKDRIASSLQELEDRPKATYEFVLISENAESDMVASKVDTIQRCYMEFGKIERDADTMKTVVELLEGRPLSPKTKTDFLKTKINDLIQRSPRMFLSTVQDELLPYKVLIRKCVEKGLIGKKNDAYYLKEDGSALCEIGEDSTLNNAAKYISSLKRQQLKYSLEAALKQD